jgi:hypothetical protein
VISVTLDGAAFFFAGALRGFAVVAVFVFSAIDISP